jgi:hypothetical protein
VGEGVTEAAVGGAALGGAAGVVDRRADQGVVEAQPTPVQREQPGLLGGFEVGQRAVGVAQGAVEHVDGVDVAGGGEQQRGPGGAGQPLDPAQEALLQQRAHRQRRRHGGWPASCSALSSPGSSCSASGCRRCR